MKTTVEISDLLLREARKIATREGVTLRTLFERGLRCAISDAAQGKPFKLRRASFKGSGLKAEFAEANWRDIRDAVYKGRGA